MAGNFKPTAAQADAIHARGEALLISAGAGSGKTRVLTERLMTYLTDERDPKNINEFLIITYTRAAAGELRARIISEIADRIRENPKNRRLRRQTALAYHSEIDTIHRFCWRIARENAHLLDISPDFRIAEQDECSAIQSEILDTLLDGRYENLFQFEGFSALVDTLSPGRDDRVLSTCVLELYDKLRSHPDGGAWAKRQLELLSSKGVANVLDTPWGAILMKKARDCAKYWASWLRGALEWCSDVPDVMNSHGACFDSVLEQTKSFLVACESGWDAARSACGFDFPGAKPLRGEEYAGIKQMWKECRDELRSLADIFTASSDVLLSDMEAVYPMTAALFALVSDFESAYAAEKKKRKLADFSDLEHFALRLFLEPDGTPTEIARAVSERYVEIMIDEYQDVSRIQELIFGAISRGGKNLVMVGDVRQSIYRFRLAEPAIFQAKYRSFSDEADSGAPGRRIILSSNFRSRSEVLHAVNHVFSRVMSERFGELDYTEREYLTPGRADADGGEPVELNILDCAKNDDREQDAGRFTMEARFVARRAKELVDTGFLIPENGVKRPAKYSDIAILLRSRTHAAEFSAALEELGIPVQTDASEPLLDCYEVKLALSILRIINNPRDDLSLISVLSSPLFRFSPDELARARLCGRDGDFFAALTAFSRESVKARVFLEVLDELRTIAPELGAEGMLWHIYGSLRLPALLGALEGDERRRANLTAFAEIAGRAADFGNRSIFQFLRVLPNMSELKAKSASAANGVRIMTIHTSKGLEFPIVFLPGISRYWNRSDTSRRMLFHAELGAGLMRVDLNRRIEYPTLPRIAIKETLLTEMKAEELRVLYVAMTRAREKLIMTYANTGVTAKLAKLLPHVASHVQPQVLSMQSGIGSVFMLAALGSPEAAELFGNAPVSDDSGIWDVRLFDINSAWLEQGPDYSEEPPAGDEPELPEPAAQPFAYPFQAASALPSKLTVTELKDRLSDIGIYEDAMLFTPAEERAGHRRPDFITETSALTGTERGTALHTAMRYLPLRPYPSEEDIKAELDGFLQRGLLSQAERAAVESRPLLRFFDSQLGKRVLAADEHYREFRFSLLVPASEHFADGGDDEILLQGIVDLAFRESDALTVVDFKTDRLENADDLRRKTEVYTPQVRSYMRAMCRVTGLSKAYGFIYFFNGGHTVEIRD